MEKGNKSELKKLFENEILTRPIIIDDDLDSYLCLAYIHSKLRKKVSCVGFKTRERKSEILSLFGLSKPSLIIKSNQDWEACSFLDFEVHGCPSVGQHLLLVYEDNMLNPNKEKEIPGDQSIGIKYPMSTIIYLLYIYDDLDNYSEEQLKLIAIADKTFQNSWKYQTNFMRWEKLMGFNFDYKKILDDESFYNELNKDYPYILNKYPELDEAGKKLLLYVLNKLNWQLPLVPDGAELNYYFYIPEEIVNVSKDNVPLDVFHHARLNKNKMWVSKKNKIILKKINPKEER